MKGFTNTCFLPVSFFSVFVLIFLFLVSPPLCFIGAGRCEPKILTLLQAIWNQVQFDCKAGKGQSNSQPNLNRGRQEQQGLGNKIKNRQVRQNKNTVTLDSEAEDTRQSGAEQVKVACYMDWELIGGKEEQMRTGELVGQLNVSVLVHRLICNGKDREKCLNGV